MAPSCTYRKRRRDKQLRRMAAMRAAKERKRQAEACAAECVGTITFDGRLFGGRHVMRCLYRCGYSETHVMIEIDGVAFRPLTAGGLRRIIARRVI